MIKISICLILLFIIIENKNFKLDYQCEEMEVVFMYLTPFIRPDNNLKNTNYFPTSECNVMGPDPINPFITKK